MSTGDREQRRGGRSERTKRGARPPSFAPRVRRGTIRVAGDIAARLRGGHPVLFRDALEATYRPRGIYEQRRYRPLSGEAPRGPATLQRGTVAPVEMEVKEAGLTFLVDVTAPLGAGLFCDLREGREVVARRAAGARV